ncbi:hypothetical protein GFY24_23970 [Nocardia sp. SYP-A9097]|uniref:hypothetical protein n=1 Tax=Nocardia sp. SYP-A9097 TaxID=2663237 RepID=UPI00129A86C5|nr:hypothetical protein [Nocardia sp. SYP-A9097]MRH90464.1 hypothetical protein [Nocardia sp. SYP-A9097]
MVEDRRAVIMEVLEHTRAVGLEDLADAAQEYLADPGGAVSPLGAAAIWVIVHYEYRGCCQSTFDHWRHVETDVTGPFVDSWISEHGLGFAASAAVLRSGMLTRRINLGPGKWAAALEVLDTHSGGVGGLGDVAEQLRARLASVPEADYRAVVERLALLRADSGADWARLTTSYLLPDQQDWVDADLALAGLGESAAAVRLLGSLTTTAQFTRFMASVRRTYIHEEHLFNMLTQIGPAGTGVIVDRLAAAHRGSSEDFRSMSALLAELPCDEAFQGLLDHIGNKDVAKALTQAMIRFPRRAMRLLSRSAAAAGAPAVVYRFKLHALAHPELVAEPGCVDAGALALIDPAGRRPAAAPADLPVVLTAPPWTKPRTKKPPVLITPEPARPLRLRWALGERQGWADTWVSSYSYRFDRGKAWDLLIDEAREAGALAFLLALSPDEDIVRALEQQRPGRHRAISGSGPDAPMRRLMGVYGDDALDFAAAAAVANPVALAGTLAPVDGTAVTLEMMRWLSRKQVRQNAIAWFDRHSVTAAVDLVQVALTDQGKDRAAARSALQLLAERGHSAAIDAAVSGLGEPARGSIFAVLQEDPLARLPAKVPGLPYWVIPAALPQLCLRDRASALPEPSVAHFVTMLAMSGPGGDYAGVAVTADLVDRKSLADFVWALFDGWRFEHFPANGGWVLHAMGLFGDDDTVTRLAPLVGGWIDDTASARAMAGLNVIAAIGGDTAVQVLRGIAREKRYSAMGPKAAAIADGIAAASMQL